MIASIFFIGSRPFQRISGLEGGTGGCLRPGGGAPRMPTRQHPACRANPAAMVGRARRSSARLAGLDFVPMFWAECARRDQFADSSHAAEWRRRGRDGVALHSRMDRQAARVAGIAQSVRAPGCGPGGRRFDPGCSPQHRRPSAIHHQDGRASIVTVPWPRARDRSTQRTPRSVDVAKAPQVLQGVRIQLQVDIRLRSIGVGWSCWCPAVPRTDPGPASASGGPAAPTAAAPVP